MKPLGSPEPVRLLAGASSEFERRLLSSAARDAMPAAALQHLAQALNVPKSALPSALGAELQRTAWLGKYAALAGLGALGVIAAVAANGGHAAPARVAAASVVPAVTTPVAAARVAPDLTPREAVSLADVSPADPTRSESARPKSAKPRPRASARTVSAPAPGSEPQGLRAELQALEAVQSALRAQHPELAADALAAYSRRFPAGELAREAELLGVDIALGRGDRELARARARELLAKPDGARYRKRLDALRIEASGSSHGSAEVTR